MKKLINLFILSFAVIVANAQAQPAGCCPEFSLSTNFIHPCDDNACKGNPVDPNGGGTAGGGRTLIACKNQPQTYYVVPALPGFSYTWTIVGGTPTNPTGNPVTINWGNADQGFLQVIIKNADSTCRDTITQKVCLLDGPTAAITYSPVPVCAGSNVYFSGAGSIGATNYYWDFGDGTYSTLQNPLPHQFSSGPHTVILTVSTVVTDSSGNTRDCGCKDTAMVTFTVLNKKGIDIHTDDCRKMLCTGDTVKYCTSTTGCGTLTWSVSGGTISSGQGTSCVTVVWNQPSVYPTSVTLTATSCPGSVCGNTATLNVPVLYPNLPIQGPQNVCANSNTSYSLPALPGTFYYWTLSGGGSIIGYDSNHNVINVTWGPSPGGPFKLVCRYTNPYSGCSGADTIDIYIKPKFTLFGPSIACVGQIANICANGPVATWTHLPNTGFTINSTTANCKNLTWNVAGNYSITATPVTPSNYCSSPALLNIVVLDTPKINPMAGPLVVCPGQTVMYSVTSNTNAGTFTWSVTNGTIIQQMGVHNDSVLVQFTANGAISVYQTVNNCSSYIQTVNVSVITSIGAITGNSPTCIDAVEVYTIAGPVPPGGYTWTLSNALGSIINTTANSITVQWNGAGPSATCIITATACSQTATKIVTVNNPPNGTITATGNLCTTGVTLTTSLVMPSYDWYKNGVFYINTAVNNINVTSPGFYKVKSPTPCYGTATINVPNTFTSSVSITADNVTVFCPGDPINVNLVATVQANNTCTYSYQWYNGVTPVGINSPSYNATAVGSYFVVISCGNCKDTSNVITISIGNCSGSCGINYNPLKAIGNDIGGPSGEITDPFADAVLSYSININPPVASPCNVVTFSANYNFVLPHTPNSGVFWNFGDGYGATSSWAGMSGTSTASPHTYTTPGIYVVSALMYSNCPPPPTPHICPVLDTIHYVVPVAANFGFNVNCKTISLSDLSTTLPSLGCSISSWVWSVTGPSGATFNNAALQNPVLTVTQSGTYNITLLVTSNCGGCQATVTYPVTVNVPSANFIPPSPICAGTAAPFSVTSTPGFSYNWNFGDGYQSNLASTTHAFAAAGSSPVTLTVTDAMGCTDSYSTTVTILPALTVSIPADKFICPGASFTLSTTPAVFTNYQWYFNGNPISGATGATYNATNIGEYYVIVNNGTGCVAKSNKMHIWHHPKPIADIQGQTIQCISGVSGPIYLYNSVTDPNYSYFWTVSPAASFSPNNTQFDANVTVGTGTYQFILTVTNTITGCIAKDTFCVYVYQSPTVTIAPTGYLCEGIMHTYNATALPPNPNYVYQWNNGATGVSMTTAQAGNYNVTVLNPATGCSAQSNMVTIKPRPYVALFPIGCDTLCDTVKLIPPLPLATGQTYNGVYVIKWYVDGSYHSTGPVLNLNLLSLGQHQIYIIVNFIGDTCAAVSGKYDLFIKHCGDCDCKESHWGEISLDEENDPSIKSLQGQGDPVHGVVVKRGVTAKTTGNNTSGTNPIILTCGKLQKLDCNKTYTISTSYFCKDSICKDSVTYSLQPPTGPAITGSAMPTLTFTITLSGTYTLTLYGWCGNKICDSCIIDFVVECKECDCKGSKWDKITLTQGQKDKDPADNPTGVKAANPKVIIDPAAITLNCKNTYKLDCNKPYTLNANYLCKDSLCPGKVTYSMQPPSGSPVTGTLPPAYNFIPNQNGTYVLTMYGWCGDKICDSCVIKFEVNCKECDCKGSKWGEQTVTIENNTKSFKCGNQYEVKCKKPITVNANYICADASCNAAVTYSLQPPSGSATTGTLPVTFTPNQSGTYTLTMYGWCGNKICDSCVIKFKTECKDCCPYEITAAAGTVKYDHTQIPNATIAAQTFTINGLASANITEVRANVMSYDITDNYGKECMKCVNLPFTWASIQSAANIGAVPGLITMYGGTGVPSFNGTGAGAYQNPREVIWNNGSPINIPNGTNIGMNFILPPVPAIDCCELKGKVCVKFTFRDNDCKECEVIACFDFVIKKK